MKIYFFPPIILMPRIAVLFFQNLILRNCLGMMGYLYVSFGRSMIVNKGSRIFGGKLFMSFVVLCQIAAESLITNAADSSSR